MECGYGNMSKNSMRRKDYNEFRTDSIEFNGRRYGVALRRGDKLFMPNIDSTTTSVNQHAQNVSALKNDNTKQKSDNSLSERVWVDSNTVIKNFNLTKNLFEKCINILGLKVQDFRLLRYNLENGDKIVTYLSPLAISLLDNLLNRNSGQFTIKDISKLLHQNYKKIEQYINLISNETNINECSVHITRNGNVYYAYPSNVLTLIKEKIKANSPNENFVLRSEFIKNNGISEHLILKYIQEWKISNKDPSQILIKNRTVYLGNDFIEYAKLRYKQSNNIIDGYMTTTDMIKILGINKKVLHYHMDIILNNIKTPKEQNVIKTGMRYCQKLYNAKLIDLIKEQIKYSANKPPEGWVSLKKIGNILNANVYTENFKKIIENILATNAIKHETFNFGVKRHTYYEPIIVDTLKTLIRKDVDEYISMAKIMHILWDMRQIKTSKFEIKKFITLSGEKHGVEKEYKVNGRMVYHINVLRDAAQYMLNNIFNKDDLTIQNIASSLRRYFRANIYYVEKSYKNSNLSNDKLLDVLQSNLCYLSDKLNNIKLTDPIRAEKIVRALVRIAETEKDLKNITKQICKKYVSVDFRRKTQTLSNNMVNTLYNAYLKDDPKCWTVTDYIFANMLANASSKYLSEMIDKNIAIYEKKYERNPSVDFSYDQSNYNSK